LVELAQVPVSLNLLPVSKHPEQFFSGFNMLPLYIPKNLLPILIRPLKYMLVRPNSVAHSLPISMLLFSDSKSLLFEKLERILRSREKHP
jgi:hypothetical protein